MQDRSSLPIGVFDSGVGGLTVLNELRRVLPQENLLYLGDTARVPYGTKSAQSVTRYAEQAARALYSRNIKALVIACNTASAVSVEHLRQLYPDIPVIGVIEPGADACCAASLSGRIGIIATEGTVNNLAYQAAILARRPDASVKAQACSLFVALAEEGWHKGELVEQIVRRCMQPLLEEGSSKIDTLVLGCTHFPVLRGVIASVVGSGVKLVDSAQTTAEVVGRALDKASLLTKQNVAGSTEFLVTDGPDRFARVAGNFFSERVMAGEVEVVDIQHF